MGISFHARRSRLKREALSELRGHSDFSHMLRSEMIAFAESREFDLDRRFNDAAMQKVLNEEFSTDAFETLEAMSKEQVKEFAKKYSLPVAEQEDICEYLGIEVPEITDLDIDTMKKKELLAYVKANELDIEVKGLTVQELKDAIKELS